MANEEHLKILRQGVEAWNAWREENPNVRPDLTRADLSGADLSLANLDLADLNSASIFNVVLRGASLRSANLTDANLAGGDLRSVRPTSTYFHDAIVKNAEILLRAAVITPDSPIEYLGIAICGSGNYSNLIIGTELYRANLRGADLRGAYLNCASLTEANLSRANLRRADLRGASLRNAVLNYADLTDADLRHAFLGEAHLRGAVFLNAVLTSAKFDHTDLSFINALRNSKGLESIVHDGPSALGVDVLQASQGQLPPVFLKGCGLSDWEIEAAKLHNPHLTTQERTDIFYEIDRIQGHQPIQLHPLFLSYSSADAPFVEALEPRFEKLGIRYWRDVHDLKAGRLETQIDRAIRLNPTVLLVLSERSVESDWVEWEVSQARKLEKELKRDVLCPVALDDAWKTCSWPGPLRRQIQDYHILDFSAWEDAGSFEGQFGKLLEGLKLFYRGEGVGQSR